MHKEHIVWWVDHEDISHVRGYHDSLWASLMVKQLHKLGYRAVII